MFTNINLLKGNMKRPYESEPVPNTCSDINRQQGELHSILKNEIKFIEDVAERAISTFEDMRDSNKSLRDWGNEWMYYATEKESELEDAYGKIDLLETKLKELEEQLEEV